MATLASAAINIVIAVATAAAIIAATAAAIAAAITAAIAAARAARRVLQFFTRSSACEKGMISSCSARHCKNWENLNAAHRA